MHLDMLVPANRGTVARPGFRYGFNPVNVGALATLAGAGYRYLTNRSGPKALPLVTSRGAAKQVAKNITRRKSFVKKVRQEVRKQKKAKSVKSRLAKVERKVSGMMSKMVFRVYDAQNFTSLQNAINWNTFYMNDAGSIETVLAQLKYYDPSAPGTLITAPGATGSYERKFTFTSTCTVDSRNNCQVPVELRVYWVRCMADTSISPEANLDNCLTDSCNLTKESPIVFPSDAVGSSQLWKVDKCKIFHLKPGGTCSVTLSCGKTTYDPSEYDNNPLAYQKGWKSSALLFRLRGEISHDNTTTTNVGYIGAVLDTVKRTTYTVDYNAGGPKMVYTHAVSNLDTMAAIPLMTVCPVADNLPASLT